ncbi:MAG: 4Fe-4S dicluster domain-containing protein [Deltaproteobacteria bacterium]|nr:4Fe-4S dicluster domain-containing protein [Deltaproteobacteria bacterium]
MLKKMFFGLSNPRIEYELLPVSLPEPEKLTASKTVTLFHQSNGNQNAPVLFKAGDKVKTGQKISLFTDNPAYVIASATGVISSISPYAGDFGKTFSAIMIDRDENEVLDDQFEKQTPNLAKAIDYLAVAPGNPPLQALSAADKEIHTIVIVGIDRDLLIGTNQYIVKSSLDDIKSGISVLKEITGIERIILISAGESIQGFGHIGAEVKNVDTEYPSALPHMIMKNVLGEIVPAGKTSEDLGVCFFTAEAVASIGKAFTSGQIPVNKILTLITKDGSQRLIETTIGTPIRDLFETYAVSVEEEDRIIIGGPMTGSAVYSPDYPVLPDTDAIAILDRSKAAYASDYPCINCGECVRACPAQMQVHMMVRFLEASQYEQAADNYDLYSCIECGLCSFVCVSRIPIFQYIKLAKYELDRAKTAEEVNA